MSKSNWLMLAASQDKSYVAQTVVPDDTLLYRALTKWLVRGSASKMLSSFWSIVEQYDNELEKALLDQFLTQADKPVDDPQITTVKSSHYEIDITVESKNSGSIYKTCRITFVLFVRLNSVKTKFRTEEVTIDLTLVKNNGEMEQIIVNTAQKTPAPLLRGSRRVSKRSSKTPTPSIKC